MANDKCNIKLIVGLGNPGSEYEHTRHNIGVDFLYKLADKYRIDMRPEGKFSGILGRGMILDHEVRLVFPTTFMNESGRSVAALCNFYKIKPEEILVCHDDLDLPAGHMKFKFGGGLAGHNGLRSITANLANDKKLIDDAYEEALLAIDKLFTDGVSKATSMINGYKPN